MKIVLFSLLCLILIGIISYSYAQLIDVHRDTKFVPEILLQLEVRDSNGILLAYLETEDITGFSPLELNRFLDNQNQTRKEFFIKDDKKYELQQWESIGQTYDKKDALSITRLLDVYQNELVVLLFMRFDSFQAQPGDTVRVFWTVIRPAS